MNKKPIYWLKRDGIVHIQDSAPYQILLESKCGVLLLGANRYNQEPQPSFTRCEKCFKGEANADQPDQKRD